MPLSSINNYEITFELRPDYLLVRVELPSNVYNTARQYLTDVIRMIHKRRYKKALINISATTALPHEDAKSLMSDFLKMIYPGIHIAIVNKHVDQEVRSSVETDAAHHGHSIKVLDDIPSAEAWLREKQPGNIPPAVVDGFVQDLTLAGRLQ